MTYGLTASTSADYKTSLRNGKRNTMQVLVKAVWETEARPATEFCERKPIQERTET